MGNSMNNRLVLAFIAVALALMFLVNVSLGSVYIPFQEIVNSLITGESENDTWKYIVLNYRLPKAVTAVLVGSGLSLSGLLMQTLFRNPLAGPYVLGISSGASLGVALLLLGSSIAGGSLVLMGNSHVMISVAASLGAFGVLTAVMVVSRQLKNTMSILIVGLMFSSLSAAVISVLAYFSSAESLQRYTFWGFGSLGNLTWTELLVFGVLYLMALLLLLPSIKPLNSLLLGENYAKSIGIEMKKTRSLILLSTSLFTGVITAFSGPIAFIGLAAPHLTKLMLNTSDHRVVLPAAALFGALIMLISDTIAQLPGSEYTLPINAITTLFGAPIVIWLLLRKRRMVL